MQVRLFFSSSFSSSCLFLHSHCEAHAPRGLPPCLRGRAADCFQNL